MQAQDPCFCTCPDWQCYCLLMFKSPQSEAIGVADRQVVIWIAVAKNSLIEGKSVQLSPLPT